MSIVLAAGGSGGHLFPAQRLKEGLGDKRIVFMGHGLANSPFFDRKGTLWHDVPSGRNPLTLLRGVWRARSLLKKEKAALVVGFGSYHSAPVLAAARLLGIPIALFEADAAMGRVSSAFAKKACLIASPFSHSYPQATQVDLPVRDEGERREEAFSYFGLDPSKPTLLIFGGSQGAQALNDLDLTLFLEKKGMQLIHITGKGKSALHTKGVIKTFETRLDLAMKCATIALCRSGSGTVNELIYFALPALLIPYPFATRGHQEANARHFERSVGGGKTLLQKDVNSGRVAEELEKLLEEKERLQKEIELYKSRGKKKSLPDAIRGIL